MMMVMLPTITIMGILQVCFLVLTAVDLMMVAEGDSHNNIFSKNHQNRISIVSFRQDSDVGHLRTSWSVVEVEVEEIGYYQQQILCLEKYQGGLFMILLPLSSRMACQ